jgi:hypothetical protein
MPDVVLVSGEEGNWEGIYIDGMLYREEDSLSAADVLAALKINYRRIRAKLDSGDTLPYNLKDVNES